MKIRSSCSKIMVICLFPILYREFETFFLPTLSDSEMGVINPTLPNKSRGVPVSTIARVCYRDKSLTR